MKPYRPLLGPFVQVLPPGQRPKLTKAKALPKPKAAPVATRPAKRVSEATAAPRRHPAAGPRPSRRLLEMCPKGHALTSQNSYLNSASNRVCSLCNLI